MLKSINYVWLIIVSIILIVVLANINLIAFIYELSSFEGLSPEQKEKFQIRKAILIKNAVLEFIILISIIFFNYTWKDYLFPKITAIKKRVVIIITCNIIILAVIIYADFCIQKYLSNKRAFNNYSLNFLINHLPTLVISFVFPYILLRIKRNKLTELNLIQIKEEKIKAELSALKEQISPHFFFNTLSTLSTIVRNKNKEVGLEFIQDMSNTYRYTLTSVSEDLVSLKEEIDFIMSYVYLLQKRFGEKLQFKIDIPKMFMKRTIPPMSLQLLIENAVQHNIIAQEQPLTIRIYIENNKICVENNLQEKEDVESFGIGLKNLTNRYKLLTKNDIIIERTSTKFIVKLPLS